MTEDELGVLSRQIAQTAFSATNDPVDAASALFEAALTVLLHAFPRKTAIELFVGMPSALGAGLDRMATPHGGKLQ